jgi:hypothetical protein
MPEETSALGAATLPEFSDAAGLESLATEGPPKRGRKPRVTSDDVSQVAPVFSKQIVSKLLAQIDHTVSILLEIRQEDQEYIDGVAETVLPLANYYASKSESVVGMWIAAGLGLLTFAVVKYQRFRERVFNAQQKAA